MKVHYDGMYNDRTFEISECDLERVRQYKWFYMGGKNGYVYRKMKDENGVRKTTYLHHFILGVKGDTEIDHADRNGENNTRHNLRFADRSNNNANKGAMGGTSKYKGVCYLIRDKRWKATIQVRGRTIHLGFYNSEVDAAHAYDVAAIKYFAEFAYLNFPDEILSDEEIEKRKYKRTKVSQYVGVKFDKRRNKWQASFTINRKTKFVGYYDNETTASISRDIAVFKHYGATLPKGMRFNHPDIFNASTVTYESIAADPQLYHRIG